MTVTARCVTFVGPLPPPIHGLAVINQAVLDEIRRACPVEVFNRAPRIYAKNQRGSRWSGILRTPILMLRFVWCLAVKRPRSLYITLSGGLGVLQDLPFAVFAILMRLRVYVHHHSFAYLDVPKWYFKLALGMLRHSTHVVLCDQMKHLLVTGYGVEETKIVTLSNAAFLDVWPIRYHRASSPEYVVGFLSNITAAKGIFTFLKLARRLQDNGVPAVMLIGGPLAKDIESRFWSTLSGLKNAKYLGPLYGEDKTAFFERLDLFVFPSTYDNEAEPIVVLEAMRAGVPTLATRRGCLRQMLQGHSGTIVPDDAVFDDFAYEWVLNRISDGHQTLADDRLASMACFASHRKVALEALSSIMAGISGGN